MTPNPWEKWHTCVLSLEEPSMLSLMICPKSGSPSPLTHGCKFSQMSLHSAEQRAQAGSGSWSWGGMEGCMVTPQNPGSVHTHPTLALPPPGRDRGAPRILCQALSQTSLAARPVPHPWGRAPEGPSLHPLSLEDTCPCSKVSPKSHPYNRATTPWKP